MSSSLTSSPCTTAPTSKRTSPTFDLGGVSLAYHGMHFGSVTSSNTSSSASNIIAAHVEDRRRHEKNLLRLKSKSPFSAMMEVPHEGASIINNRSEFPFLGAIEDINKALQEGVVTSNDKDKPISGRAPSKPIFADVPMDPRLLFYDESNASRSVSERTPGVTADDITGSHCYLEARLHAPSDANNCQQSFGHCSNQIINTRGGGSSILSDGTSHIPCMDPALSTDEAGTGTNRTVPTVADVLPPEDFSSLAITCVPSAACDVSDLNESEVAEEGKNLVWITNDWENTKILMSAAIGTDLIQKNLALSIFMKHIVEIFGDFHGCAFFLAMFRAGSKNDRLMLTMKVAHAIVDALQGSKRNSQCVQQMIVIAAEDVDVLRVISDGIPTRMIYTLAIHPHANHGLQMLLKHFPLTLSERFIAEIIFNAPQIATKRHGCFVAQRAFDAVRGNEILSRSMILLVSRNAEAIMSDHFANYFAQHLIQQASAPLCNLFAECLKSRVIPLSLHKYASNVIDQCCFVKTHWYCAPFYITSSLSPRLLLC